MVKTKYSGSANPFTKWLVVFISSFSSGCPVVFCSLYHVHFKRHKL